MLSTLKFTPSSFCHVKPRYPNMYKNPLHVMSLGHTFMTTARVAGPTTMATATIPIKTETTLIATTPIKTDNTDNTIIKKILTRKPTLGGVQIIPEKLTTMGKTYSSKLIKIMNGSTPNWINYIFNRPLLMSSVVTTTVPFAEILGYTHITEHANVDVSVVYAITLCLSYTSLKFIQIIFGCIFKMEYPGITTSKYNFIHNHIINKYKGYVVYEKIPRNMYYLNINTDHLKIFLDENIKVHFDSKNLNRWNEHNKLELIKFMFRILVKNDAGSTIVKKILYNKILPHINANDAIWLEEIYEDSDAKYTLRCLSDKYY